MLCFDKNVTERNTEMCYNYYYNYVGCNMHVLTAPLLDPHSACHIARRTVNEKQKHSESNVSRCKLNFCYILILRSFHSFKI